MGIVGRVLEAYVQTLAQRVQEQALQMGYVEGYNGNLPQLIDIPFAPPECRVQSFYDSGYRMGQQQAMIERISGQHLLPLLSGSSQ